MEIVLSRTDRIGDLILSTPAIASVRQSFPQAHLTLVCSAHNRVAVERNPDIDRLLVLPSGVKPRTFGAQLRGADLAIALAPRSDDIALAGATRAPVRVGYTYVRRYLMRLRARFLLNRTMLSEADPDLCDRDPGRRVRHEVDQLNDLAALAGATHRVERLRLDVNDEDRAAIAYLPQSPIVVHLGLRWFSAGSTLESTIAMLRDLRGFDVPLVVTYAPEAETFVEAISRSRAADLLLGGLPFHRWAAVFERAAVVVTVDTGATHVASAMRRPTVVVFEHRYFRLNSQEWAPYRVPSVSIRKPPDEQPESLAALRNDVRGAVAQLLNPADRLYA